jgi:hypothetical protein
MELVSSPIFMAVLGTLGVSIVLLYYFLKDRGKQPVLYWESETECRIIWVKVKDGRVKLKDKTYLVDKVTPVHMRIKGKFYPFLSLKWDCAIPLDFSKKWQPTAVSPKNLTELIHMSFMDKLLLPEKGWMEFLWLAIGIVIGIVIGIGIAPMLPKGTPTPA